MPLKIYNTLSQEKENFQPINPDKVKMYVCGITPYDETHLGHGRAYVTFDIVRRYLEFSGFEVEYFQNVTDIDDKLIKKAQDGGTTVESIATSFMDSYKEVMEKLNVLPPKEYVKATDHIKEMIKWVEGLIAKGFAYEIDGDVYFEIDKFKDYGKLSKRKKEDLLSGARVAVDERKKSPLDFALWKAAKEGEPSWASPWGKGRPGWHIECSVMSTKYLGEQFDIHGGGRDLIFPHHENEIAQTEAETCKVPWVKYWLHNGFVNINKQKMSKSLGNFFTLRDIFKQFDPMVVRLFFLSTHYRSPIDFSDGDLKEHSVAFRRLIASVMKMNRCLEFVNEGEIDLSYLNQLREEFFCAMDDDFNTALALASLFSLLDFVDGVISKKQATIQLLSEAKKTVDKFCNVLGLNIAAKPEPDDVKKSREQRNIARSKKLFNEADEIRDRFSKKDIYFIDTPYTSGTSTSTTWFDPSL
ncbi:cysteine--tRNA ligase [candidate division WOR-1 bacterium RIFOXYB2_FULL_42_35]|uniref:Cysteine--tRNA ligase n=1 Tax=candidate division WOR-1 bacterium RIFOXYC2_FULL_41_25 TaxID=1802586 RepID=A0A1F4TPG8_UNCSA|nr:MAG: cysteine--tRNA ligase [candidate division WOR-1 bacterium RIFOXYB2_FULL_42_35]OGC24560.1 MAG: cysteine--tRNA ligase [candidate division WOR-1 bacterium RIFOXYA2_FULL_41_14]OGC34605.1 MAG: cysteine--tRNA ligase [candidate division WOR-1 bacterium RIFOXYC2_FULL_41_25]OGC43988.1 MAG: cysteine--tRNA ligase [candidate division WOR-1 bacterium RIFOXYD2_FULL_41_8]